jgi:hypothetical protein
MRLFLTVPLQFATRLLVFTAWVSKAFKAVAKGKGGGELQCPQSFLRKLVLDCCKTFALQISKNVRFATIFIAFMLKQIYGDSQSRILEDLPLLIYSYFNFY